MLLANLKTALRAISPEPGSIRLVISPDGPTQVQTKDGDVVIVTAKWLEEAARCTPEEILEKVGGTD